MKSSTPTSSSSSIAPRRASRTVATSPRAAVPRRRGVARVPPARTRPCWSGPGLAQRSVGRATPVQGRDEEGEEPDEAGIADEKDEHARSGVPEVVVPAPGAEALRENQGDDQEDGHAAAGPPADERDGGGQHR